MNGTGTSPITVPLRDRVAAPKTAELPATTAVVWRHPTEAEIDVIFACAIAMGEVDHPHYVATREELANEFSHSYVQLDTDSIAGFAEDGSCVAYGLNILPPGQETLVRVILTGGVHPRFRGRGLGRALLEWQLSRGRQQLASSDSRLPGWLMAYAEESATGSAHLYARAGLPIARYFLQLTRDLSAPIDDAPVAAGVTIVPFTEELLEPSRIARNDAFRDHWGSQSISEEAWEANFRLPTFRADLSRMVLAPTGEVAGFVLVSTNSDDWVASGYSSAYIDLVGVGRDWRGQGIASQLLTQVLAACAAEDLEKAVLDVDAVNPTGALGLYQRLGFIEDSTSMAFVMEL